ELIERDHVSDRRGGWPGGQIGRQLLDCDRIAGAEDDGTLDDVPQLAHVAGPGIGFEGSACFIAQCHYSARAMKKSHQALGKRQDVVEALAERGKVDLDDIEAIEQVAAKAAGAYS